MYDKGLYIQFNELYLVEFTDIAICWSLLLQDDDGATPFFAKVKVILYITTNYYIIGP